MRKIAVAMTMIALVTGKLLATPPGKAITGSKHDFKTTGYTSDTGVTYTAYNKCGACHAAHNAKRVDPLWGRADATTAGWIVWNSKNALAASKTGTGEDLNTTSNPDYLSAADFVKSGSGLCMSCHDGQTAIGTVGAAPGTPVVMQTLAKANWGRDLSNMHPVGRKVPFGTPGWQTDVAAGNAGSGSNVVVDLQGTVGCISCHSMHSSSNSGKILRAGERCLSCHDR